MEDWKDGWRRVVLEKWEGEGFWVEGKVEVEEVEEEVVLAK